MSPFGDLLTDMERIGIKVDTENHLKKAEQLAREERQKMLETFMKWVEQHCPDARYINTASTIQMQQLFFGHFENKELISETRIFKIDKSAEEISAEEEQAKSSNPFAGKTAPELKAMLKEKGLKGLILYLAITSLTPH